MSTAIVAAQSGSSPFDAIRHEDDRGEHWLGRELMPLLSYDTWRRFSDALDRAKVSCEVAGFQASEHFAGAGKSSLMPNGGSRKLQDVRLSRYGCYLVAMCGDVRKEPVARAQAYFALKTREAELLAVRQPTQREGPWSVRLIKSLNDHKRELFIAFPNDFTVISAISTELLCIEQSLHAHLLPTGEDDLPDGSVGSRWRTHCIENGRESFCGFVPLYMPSRDFTVGVRVYPNEMLSEYRLWFNRVYLPKHLPAYLAKKPQFKEAGKLVAASAADHACRSLTGTSAHLPPKVRTQLESAGGFVRAGDPCAIAAPKRKALPARHTASLFDTEAA